MTHHEFKSKFTDKNGKLISIIRTEPIKAGYYRCHCQNCNIDFFVNEDFAFHIQQKETDDESELLPDVKTYCGLTVFEVHCPRCGQKLMFSFDATPIGDLEWVER